MRQIINFNKDLEFKENNINIESISINHEEEVQNEEINGYFIVYGKYKTELNSKDFNFKVPYTTILPIEINKETIKVDIDNFTYKVNNNILNINVDYLIEGTEIENREVEVIEQKEEIINNIKEETILYHIHIVKENETIENILKEYNVDIDTIKEYNDIKELKKGTKLIIPEINE